MTIKMATTKSTTWELTKKIKLEGLYWGEGFTGERFLGLEAR